MSQSLIQPSITIALMWFTTAAGLAEERSMIFPGTDWQEVSPEAEQIDPGRLQHAIDGLMEKVGTDGVTRMVVLRNGRIVWKGNDIDHRQGVWSCTKSFTSTALGLLIDDGKVQLKTHAAELLPTMANTYPDVTLRHFTTMTSGYRAIGDEPRGGYAHGPSSTPFLPGDKPLFLPPGSQFAYWDSAMNQFANALTKVAGEPLESLFKRRIADPIGMVREDWDWGDLGEVNGISINGGSGNSNKHIQITARQFARFGHLFLNRGNWDGKQLISDSWVLAATSAQVPASLPWGHPTSDIDGRGVYGFNWWTNGTKPDGTCKWPSAPLGTFAAAGYNNNKCFVIPEWQMVVVRLGLDGNVPDDVWNDFFERLATAVDLAPPKPSAP
ncbi:serine hydrolase domain-containing protein [Novipirellula artificiosorum]|uniref:D-alanyl-D-alanine-carboxypeptidase/endopeptidase AmpH n=1 Tax=Novipirellula artificiosorum TaxID=2528016 RepID=A0A5C6CMH2_9BACT|nr:serine hydrolase [Novipirellula artificiosorum]TWU26133.1 D-alanyl-D-alanine-carboxypeptidase/endopeptidase AmpH precursor [Novipirellula artificiosorum]